jgi:bifunctional N-acetylglucosamine-1-phosphate-uridyltransferase/glucosamine-1-phosphate-acetyltransferase GlmU-like protein
MRTNILILAAGQSTQGDSDWVYPACLTEISGVSLLERIVSSTRKIAEPKYTFAFRKDDIERFHLDNIALLLNQGSRIVSISEPTKGSACTALLASCQLPDEDALLILSANEFVDMDLAEAVTDFVSRGLDGGALIFRSIHPRYSYVRVDAEGFVTEAAQRNPISQDATAGVFWFRKTRSFISAAMAMIKKNSSVGGDFYLAPTFNELILDHKKVGVFSLRKGVYHPLKTARQAQIFELGAIE